MESLRQALTFATSPEEASSIVKPSLACKPHSRSNGWGSALLARSILFLLAAAVGPAQELSTSPAAPTGKWTVDELPTGCRATRTFGSSGDTVLQFLARPITGTYLLTVAVNRPINVSYGDPVSVTLQPSGKQLQGSAVGFSPFVDRPKIVGVIVDAAPFEGISAISLSTKREVVANLAVDQFSALTEALKKCEDGMLASFGVDLTAQRAVAMPPKPLTDQSNWVRTEDYPIAAFQAQEQGAVAGRYKVAADGSVSDCVVVISSGSEALDGTTCALFLRRAKFLPAQAEDGTPIVSAQIFVTRWALPTR